MSTRRRLPPDERRGQIVATASRVFAERPYDEVSTTEIAQACGVSRGLLNHYFPTKRELYLAVIGRLLGAPRLPTPAFVEGATAEGRIEESVREWVDMVSRSRETWLAASGFLGASRDEEIERLLNAYVESMSDQICEIAGLHAVRDDPAVRVALHGYSAYATVVTRRWLSAGEITREQAERLLGGALITLVRQTIPSVIG
ncbi:TetR/AcrR family transcriptional regulator [Mumia sp. DW29H23]|uniref:TetR/AcrR family transcriptional regulator n=1 Tax=Mumia sp. DW29H23 TaxID=3421241 RepID=UPI003D6803F9